MFFLIISRFPLLPNNSDRAPLPFLNKQRSRLLSFLKTTIALPPLPTNSDRASLPFPKTRDRASLPFPKPRSRSLRKL
ncbi:hypothetical protein [Halothece sp. PCC 7418]|uniref:hypothetical protein n=1 Tax=Halothece sp. (strain PCC 7418) TaxID=65093 RepID=UPI0003137B2E|nr:hypothetical protein [Halothece sp. PCC 7418]